MRHVLVLIAISAIAAPLLAADLPATNATAVAPAFSIEVEIHPSAADPYQLLRRPTPETYSCRAFIGSATDEHFMYAVADVVAMPGKRETASRTFAGEYRMNFTVDIHATGRAKAVVEILHDDTVVTRQTSTVWLQRPPGRNVPAQ